VSNFWLQGQQLIGLASGFFTLGSASTGDTTNLDQRVADHQAVG
jgi:hypothetical protein